MNRPRAFGVKEKYLLLAMDSMLVFSSYIFAEVLSLWLGNNFSQHLLVDEMDWFAVVAMLVFPVVFYVFDLYEQERWLRNIKLLIFITAAVLFGCALIAIGSYLYHPKESLERTTLCFYIVYSIFLLFAFRKIVLRLSTRKNKKKHRILLIGNDTLLDEILHLLRNQNGSTAVSVTRVAECTDESGREAVCDVMSGKSIHRILEHNHFATIVVSTDLMNFPQLKQKLIDLRFAGVKVYDTPDFYEALTAKVAVNYVKDSWFLFRNQGISFNPRMYLKVKKVVEKIVALAMIIGFGPLMLLVAITIKCFSPGPILYRQQRIGQQGKTFTLYKFRTMVANADDENVPVWLKSDESKITGINKLLRKTRFDELPQLYNVLKGDMSFTGPRPIRRYAANLLAEQIPYYRLRFMVKPGVTGWAQVLGGYGHTLEEQLEKLEYDLYYIQNQSALFDLLIILKTIRAMIFGKGS